MDTCIKPLPVLQQREMQSVRMHEIASLLPGTCQCFHLPLPEGSLDLVFIGFDPWAVLMANQKNVSI